MSNRQCIANFLCLVPLLSCCQASARADINGGMSGSWFDPAVPGQGLVVDVFAEQQILFAAWFTFTDDGQQQWMTLQGPISSNVAELGIFRTQDGRFAVPSATTTEAIGQATLEFSTCTQATLRYQFTGSKEFASLPLVRLSPDLFCDEINQHQAQVESSFNRPPEVNVVDVSAEPGFATVEINYIVDDAELDPVDVKIEVVGSDGQVYPIPGAHLRGNHGFPVIGNGMKQIVWRIEDDAGASAITSQPFQLRVVADDRFIATLQDIVDLVSEERLIADVEAMEGVRHHAANPEFLEATRNYIRDQMLAAPVSLTEQSFIWQGSEGINLIGSTPGAETSYYLIDGHYDSVTTTPGADDNASGTAGMLEAMRVLSQFNFQHGVRFVGFDKEELGLRGSRHYAANLSSDETVLGMINFEMIGYTCHDQPECLNMRLTDTSIYNIRSAFANELSNVFAQTGATHVPQLKISSSFDDGDPNLRRSDHAPFWDLGIDALFLTDGANFRTPHYHQPTDRIGVMDTEFMTNVVKTAVGTIATVAGASHSGSDLSELLTK